MADGEAPRVQICCPAASEVLALRALKMLRNYLASSGARINNDKLGRRGPPAGGARPVGLSPRCYNLPPAAAAPHILLRREVAGELCSGRADNLYRRRRRRR